MSLVVAQATDDGPRIVADTRVTLTDRQAREPGFKGTLKAVVVGPDAVVCFAGDIVAGLGAVRDVARGLQAGETVDGLLAHLQAATSDPRREVEFIVATGQPDSEVARIRDGSIERSLNSAWIGDHGAFERFQQARHAPVHPGWAELESKLPASTREG